MVGAIVVDYGNFQVARSSIQNAADAAALAAAMRLGNENSNQARDEAVTFASAFANYNQVGQGDVLSKDDIVYGHWDPKTESFAVAGNPIDANAVQVQVRRGTESTDGIATYFMSIFGVSEVKTSMSAVATMAPSSTADVIPVALRDPSFGDVVPEMSEHNVDLDGPSSPEQGDYFRIGEEVVVMMYGDESSHLTLAWDAEGGGASKGDVEKILSGEENPVEIQVGDTVEVHDDGAGNGKFGEELEARLALDSDAPGRDVVLPVVETTDASRDDNGKLKGEVRVSDFVSVHLDEVVEEEVVDPDDPDKFVTVKLVMGTVTTKRQNTAWGGGTPSGVGGKTVTIAELVN